MIVGLYQCASPKGDLPAGLETVETALAKASDGQVDMLVMPEAFLPGYGATPSSPPAGWDMVKPRLSELCRHHGIGLTIGLPEYHAGHVFNTALAMGADGQILASYRKIQLFGPREKELYQPGDDYVVFDYLGKRWGLLICYDVEFPEHVRALARAGADIVLVPTANMDPFVNVNEIMVPSRAAENGVTIVYANYCGAEGPLSYTGRSVICGPDGYPTAGGTTGAGLCVAHVQDSGDLRSIPLSTQHVDLRRVE